MAYKFEAARKANARKYYEAKGRKNSEVIVSRNREYTRKYKAEHPCADCGESRWWVLDFDHRDETIKLYNVSRMECSKLSKIDIEIAKCDIRCKNCHADRHYREYLLKAHKG